MSARMPNAWHAEVGSRRLIADIRDEVIRELGGDEPFRTESVPNKYIEPPPPWALSPVEHEAAILRILDRLDP